MIEVTRLNGQRMVINGDLIERIEALPDTILSLTTGRKLIVRESVHEMVEMLTEYRRSLFRSPVQLCEDSGSLLESHVAPEPV